MRACLGLPCLADHLVADGAGWKQPGSLTQTLCLFGKTFFQWVGLFETASLHWRFSIS
jgi:hypothetical protein